MAAATPYQSSARSGEEALEIGFVNRHPHDMAISEETRSDLYTGLRDVLGPERAETLMSAIPLHPLDEVATKAGVEIGTAALRTEMADLRTEVADLRTEMADLRTELKADMSGLRVELLAEIGALRRSFTTWLLTLLVAIIGAMATIGWMT